jgi:hypothetical protein
MDVSSTGPVDPLVYVDDRYIVVVGSIITAVA